MAGQGDPPRIAGESGFPLQGHAALPGQFPDEIGTRVVASAPVFITGIAQSDNEPDSCHRGCPTPPEETQALVEV